jgi:hypothetical protein
MFGRYHYFGRKDRGGDLNSDLRPTMLYTPSKEELSDINTECYSPAVIANQAVHASQARTGVFPSENVTSKMLQIIFVA